MAYEESNDLIALLKCKMAAWRRFALYECFSSLFFRHKQLESHNINTLVTNSTSVHGIGLRVWEMSYITLAQATESMRRKMGRDISSGISRRVIYSDVVWGPVFSILTVDQFLRIYKGIPFTIKRTGHGSNALLCEHGLTTWRYGMVRHRPMVQFIHFH